VAVLPQHDDPSFARLGDDSDEVAGLEVVVVVDHSAIRQRDGLDRDLDEGRRGIDLPSSQNAPWLDHRVVPSRYSMRRDTIDAEHGSP
jgi:hypothetical protein